MDLHRLKVVVISYSILGIMLLVLFSVAFSAIGTLPVSGSLRSDQRDTRSQTERVLETGYDTAEEPVSGTAVFTAINRYREERDLPTLRFDHALSTVAGSKIETIVADPDGSDRTSNSYAELATQRQRLTYPDAEQLLAYSSLDSEGVAYYLLNSQPYRGFLLDPEATAIGISVEYTDALSPELQKALVVGYITTGD